MDFAVEAIPRVLKGAFGPVCPSEAVRQTLRFVCADLVPRLRRTDEEIVSLLHALEGGYVPAGPSGAPTRGMAHVLPTGRNFYTVDPRALPSQAAWEVGQQLADGVIRRFLAEEGRYPESVGISIWGTSAMRTHGDDLAEVFALIGVRPRWQAESRRVIGFDVIPLADLGRPRIDVICRISGFFRDAFPHLIALLDEAFQTVASLEEPPEQNFVRRHYRADRQKLVTDGLTEKEASRVASYRVFGCKPGSYGAGILPLIDERNWRDAADFAETYVTWGGYAYTADAYGVDARDTFRRVLGDVQVAVKNQDNREHDIFDSDDYLQYHGGMIATIRALSGKNPRKYFGDSADPARPRVRDLKEEALRVFRTRVVNPKWIESIQRHGYKGALELAATVDYLFGYDATADVVDDWMYARVAETYALDPKLQAFFEQSNPWALRDLTARLLEAIDRGLWAEPGDLQRALQQTYLATDAALETAGERSGGRR
jgi:cobaltochelatase CobN